MVVMEEIGAVLFMLMSGLIRLSHSFNWASIPFCISSIRYLFWALESFLWKSLISSATCWNLTCQAKT